MADKLDIDGETAEFVLAHLKKGVEAAYRRGTALARCRIAMRRYAELLAAEAEPAAEPGEVAALAEVAG
jgi:hypothetical protein